MAAALLTFAAAIAFSLMPGRQTLAQGAADRVAWGGTALSPALRAWVGPLAVLVIVGAMYGFSAVGFEIMKALPVIAQGGGGHH
jgi:cytochrome c oxidase subunit 1